MIQIMKIVPPESGWPIALHCAACGKTVIVHNPYGCKPARGDYYLVQLCPEGLLAHDRKNRKAAVGLVVDLFQPSIGTCKIQYTTCSADDPWALMADRHAAEEAGKR